MSSMDKTPLGERNFETTVRNTDVVKNRPARNREKLRIQVGKFREMCEMHIKFKPSILKNILVELNKQQEVLEYNDIEHIWQFFANKYAMYYGKQPTERIRRAFEVSAFWHQTQTRRNSAIYLSHPIQCALIVMYLSKDLGWCDAETEHAICVMLCHDTIEDGPVNHSGQTRDDVYDDLCEKVNVAVANAVRDNLTNPEGKPDENPEGWLDLGKIEWQIQHFTNMENGFYRTLKAIDKCICNVWDVPDDIQNAGNDAAMFAAVERLMLAGKFLKAGNDIPDVVKMFYHVVCLKTNRMLKAKK